MKLSFEFEGTVEELRLLLTGVPNGTVVRVCVVPEVELPVTLSLQSRTWQECLPLVKAGNKIQAIKLWRNSTGLGLREAKDEIERRGVEAGIYKIGKSGWLTHDRSEWINNG